MRIGIITIHNSPNYGACLQAFALWKYLINCGYECEIIDLHRPHQADYVPSKKYRACRYDKDSLRTKIKKLLYRLLGKQAHRYLTDDARKKFDAFNSQIKLSRPFLGVDELYSNPPQYDVYITGSDQLWNPTQPFCIEPYFLTFVPKGKRKISYSSSIGIIELTEKEKSLFRNALVQYDAISVREIQAKQLLQSLIDNKIEQVADPTFLLPLETWKSISVKPNLSEKYLLLFTLGFNKPLMEYAIRLGNQSGMRIVYLTAIQPGDNGQYQAVVDAGPREWIGYIANAEMVITDSFHGTVFSIIMGANNFFTYISQTNQRGSRITDLLATFGLTDHLLNTDLHQTYSELSSTVIEHGRVSELIHNERLRSQNFINQHLS